MNIDNEFNNKIFCGYQGWYSCDGDGSSRGFSHWSRNKKNLNRKNLLVDMWPFMNEYQKKYSVLKNHNLFSNMDFQTTLKHFQWMRQYEIDGIFKQRFLVRIKDEFERKVLMNVVRASEKTNRLFAISYDTSKADKTKIMSILKEDWKNIEKLVQKPNYIKYKGKPVIGIFCFYRRYMTKKIAQQIIDFYKKKGLAIMGHTINCAFFLDFTWNKIFKQLDIICPWDVGYTKPIFNTNKVFNLWFLNRLISKKVMPIIYPGFRWQNLKRNEKTLYIPRNKGKFMWAQFCKAKKLGFKAVFIAMFDELNESTAIFKTSRTPPKNANLIANDLKPDGYLKITKEGGRLLKGLRKDFSLPKV